MPTTEETWFDVEPRWRAAPLARALASCAAVALCVAVLGSRWQLIAFGAPLLGALAVLGWQPRAHGVRLHAEPGVSRCFEGETVTVRLWLRGSASGSAVLLGLPTASGAQVDVVEADCGRCTVEVTAQRWGRYRLAAPVTMTAPGALLESTVTVGFGDVFVFPVAPPQATAMPRADLLERLGTHLMRQAGHGVEYADVRGYVAGDQLRSVNWPVSMRRGSLHVTERLSERAADLVVLVDAYRQPAGPATAAMDRTVRGAVQIAQSALRNGDRAGVVVLGGGRPRWLGIDIGRRQFYRVLDAVLGAGAGFVTTTGTLSPRAAVPPGAIVVALSTLLDTDFALALIDLAKRGHPVLAVDVLAGAPFPDEPDPLLTRMWLLQRAFMYRDMRSIGVDIVSWPESAELGAVMHSAAGARGGRTAKSGRAL